MKNEQTANDTYSIDLMQVLAALWKRAWIIVLCAVVCGAICFSIASFLITPTYSSEVKLYVNNKSVSLGSTSFSISSSDITASQSLLKTYGEVLQSRTTLEKVIEKSGVDCTWEALSGMITYSSLNGTEIMLVSVVCDDPYTASKIANVIADVLPERINEIIDGATMQIVDSAIPDLEKVAPDITEYTAIGFVIGAFISAMIIAILAVLDDTVHDEEYVLNTYGYPILGKVPDLLSTGGKSYSYGKYRREE